MEPWIAHAPILDGIQFPQNARGTRRKPAGVDPNNPSTFYAAIKTGAQAGALVSIRVHRIPFRVRAGRDAPLQRDETANKCVTDLVEARSAKVPDMFGRRAEAREDLETKPEAVGSAPKPAFWKYTGKSAADGK
jgi:hypothetical protein